MHFWCKFFRPKKSASVNLLPFCNSATTQCSSTRTTHQVLWESPSKVLLQQQKHGKPTKVISKKPTPNKPLQQPVLTDTLVPGDGSFLCNFCDKEFSHVAALDHWNGSHSSQDVYTNTAIGTNVRIQEMFRLVGQSGRLACGKYVAVSGANKNIFRMHKDGPER